MATMLGSLLVSLGLESAQFDRGLERSAGGLKGFQKSAQNAAKSLATAGAAMTASLTASFVTFGKLAIDGAVAQRQAVAQVESAIASMGNAAGRTSEQLVAASDALELKSLFDGDVILKQVTANLLTFGNVAGEQFDRAQQAALDMATRLGGEPQAAAIMLGKALNDPVKGITALTRVGVQFTEQQKAQIAAMSEAGNTAGAQSIILAEVEKQFAGAAAAAAKNSPYREMQVVLGQLGDVVGEILLPFMVELTSVLTEVAKQFRDLDPETQKMVVAGGAIAAGLGPALLVLGGMASGISAIVSIAPALATAFGIVRVAALALMANHVILGFAAVLTGIYLAWQNWDKITAIVQRLYTGVKTWLMDKLGAVFNWLRDKIKAVTGFFFDMYDAVVGNSYVPDMVEGIGQEFARLQTLMVDPAQRAADDVKTAMRNMASEASGLLARLFPEMEEARRQAADMATLRDAEDAELISGQTRFAGLKRLLGPAAVSNDLLDTKPLADGAKEYSDMQKKLRDDADNTARTVAESFGQMADRTLQALDRMTSAIRGGGFLDILGSVLNFGLQLGGMGVFGKGFQSRVNQGVPGFANGTRFAPGGLAMVGERGPELVNLPRGSQVIPNRDLGRMGGSMVQVVPSPYFDVVVDGRIQTATPGIAQGGAQLAASQRARMQSRMVRR